MTWLVGEKHASPLRPYTNTFGLLKRSSLPSLVTTHSDLCAPSQNVGAIVKGKANTGGNDGRVTVVGSEVFVMRLEFLPPFGQEIVMPL